jgi:hypothetical protein
MYLPILLLATAASAAVIAPKLALRQSQAQCNTGSPECCNSVVSASSPQASVLLGLLGVVVGGLNTSVGITCKYHIPGRRPTSWQSDFDLTSLTRF